MYAESSAQKRCSNLLWAHASEVLIRQQPMKWETSNSEQDEKEELRKKSVRSGLPRAFGMVQWADALRAVKAEVPKLTPVLALQWRVMQVRLWLQDETGIAWHVMVIYRSLLQGGLDGHPVFCIVIGVVLLHISNDGRLSQVWAQILVAVC